MTLIIGFWAQPLAYPHFSRWILWNVGQGQWLTYSSTTSCHHLDMGGERAPWQRIKEECGSKTNSLSLSHWDWDHLSLIRKAKYQLGQLCLMVGPNGPVPHSPAKRNLLKRLPPCPAEHQPVPWQELNWSLRQPHRAQANDHSRVMITNSFHILVPGDSPIRQEVGWAPKLTTRAHHIKILVLGHHGSRTSSSIELLHRLRGLRQSWVSARKNRYGHPHPKVRAKLNRRGIPVLRTENWGNLIVETKP